MHGEGLHACEILDNRLWQGHTLLQASCSIIITCVPASVSSSLCQASEILSLNPKLQSLHKRNVSPKPGDMRLGAGSCILLSLSLRLLVILHYHSYHSSCSFPSDVTAGEQSEFGAATANLKLAARTVHYCVGLCCY